MKVSLAWIYKHIVGSVDAIHLPNLITRFNESVAEIEGFYRWNCNPENFLLVSVDSVAKTGIKVQVPLTKKNYTLPFRDDLFVGDHVLVKLITDDRMQWATMSDCGSIKESFLPALDPNTVRWDHATLSDTILEIDNKSITHRPDLWSHRGLAREIAALYGLTLKNDAEFLSDVAVIESVPSSTIHKEDAPTLNIEAPDACRRLAAGYVSAAWQPSNLSMILWLCRVDARPINALVDCTNYAMFDYGQPMHAFDADLIKDGTLTVRYAQVGEKLLVLDGSLLELHSHDLILADTTYALSLAGIMGGSETAVTRATKRLCIEAGSFEPAVIRQSVQRHHKRTEAAMRFEKNLDPSMPVNILKRYIALLKQYGIPYENDITIVSCGAEIKPITIIVTHQFIEARLGITLLPDHIETLLTQRAFKVRMMVVDGGPGYRIEVPSFRATKDIRIPEDIVEEVARSIGYKNIPASLPQQVRTPSVAQATYRVRDLKKYCSTVLRMHEISSYAFYDEAWLNFLHWQPANAVEAVNPVSGNWKRLVSSLIPALLKAVHENTDGIADIRYFEVARTWLNISPLIEQQQLAGIIYTRNPQTDFYTLKEYVSQLCAAVGIVLTWRPVTETLAPWYDPYRVAHCFYNDQIIGTVGILAESFKERIVQTGFIGIFELNCTLLAQAQIPVQHYTPLPKYPDIVRDVSVLISSTLPAGTLATQIKAVDTRITKVEVIDFFKRPEWHDRISLSFRYTIQESTRTLTTPEADTISDAIELMLRNLDGEIR